MHRINIRMFDCLHRDLASVLNVGPIVKVDYMLSRNYISTDSPRIDW